MKPLADDMATMDTPEASFEEQEPQYKAGTFVNQSKTIDPGRSVNVCQAALRKMVNEEVERQVAHHLQYLIANAVEDIVLLMPYN